LHALVFLGFFPFVKQTGSEVLYFAEGWGRWWCAGHLVLVGVRSQSVICLCFRRSKQAHGFIGFRSFVFILTWRYLQTCSQSSTAGVSMHSPAPGQLLVLSLCLVSVLSPFSQQTLIAFIIRCLWLSVYKISDFEAPLAACKFEAQADQCCDGVLERRIGGQNLGR
jgi:hypothetical protein